MNTSESVKTYRDYLLRENINNNVHLDAIDASVASIAYRQGYRDAMKHALKMHEAVHGSEIEGAHV